MDGAQIQLSYANKIFGAKEIEDQVKGFTQKLSEKYKIQLGFDNTQLKSLVKQVEEIQGKLKGNPITLPPPKINPPNDNEIELYKTKMQNALSRLEIGKDKVFTSPEIQQQVKTFTDNLNKFGTVGSKSTKELGVQFDSLRTKIQQVSKSSEVSAQSITSMARKFTEWYLLAGIITGVIKGFSNGVKYILDIDNALNEIRIVTGQSKEQVQGLAKSYNQLAKEMSSVTTEIAKVSVELYRQGLSASEVDERMKSIIKYAKISSISLADSEKIITATANATGESVTKITDIFSFLGDQTASGADEIGEALQRVASAAENSNISIEKSASWIATISSKTRESAGIIGRSLKFEALVA